MQHVLLLTSLFAILFSPLTWAQDRFDRLFTRELDELNEFKRNGGLVRHEAGRAFTINESNRSAWINVTPTQPEGPFYPIVFPNDVDTDLTVLDGGTPAEGIVVYVRGQVLDLDKKTTIKNATVEIWQACASGKYNHSSDPNDAPIDPNFQYYGKTETDENGNYIFKTIVPGAYPASRDWWRPEHIHMKVKAAGYKSLTTQMYFNPESFPGTPIGKYNASDRILRQLDQDEQAALTASFTDDANLKSKVGIFSVTLVKR